MDLENALWNTGGSGGGNWVGKSALVKDLVV